MQSLNILVVVHRHDRDFTGTNLSNQRGRLDATPGIRTNHDPMLLRRDISAANNPPRFQFSLAPTITPFGRTPVDQTFEETMNKDTHTPERPMGSV